MANTTVKSEQIEDGSITADKIADGAIVATELADNAVTTAKINADAVTGAKIADDAINSEHYTDGSIDTAHIADDQVTQAKIADDAVGADQLAASAVVTASIVDDNVTTAKIADGNISTALLADTAVTSAKLANNIDIAGTFDVTGATTLDSTLTVKGATVFNEDSADVDFRVESNDNANMFFVDGGNNEIGIGTNDPDATVEIVSSDPRIRLRDDTAGGAADGGGIIEFVGYHAGSSDGKREWARITGLKSNGTGGNTEGYMKFHTRNSSSTLTEAMHITSSQSVGIGLDPTGYGKLSVNGTGVLAALRASSGAGSLGFYEAGAGRFYLKTLDGSDGLAFIDGDGSTEHMRITSDGCLQIHANADAVQNAVLDVRDVDNVTSLNVQNNAVRVDRAQGTTAAPTLSFNKSRGSFASYSNSLDGDFVGAISFRGFHTSSFYQAASIECKLTSGGTVSASSMPGDIEFNTSPNTTNTVRRRMRILSTGVTEIGNSGASTLSDFYTLVIQTENGYGRMGSHNSTYFHHETDRTYWYWNEACQAVGGFSTYSDERLKKDITPVTDALDSVAKMKGVTFKWIDPAKGGKGEGDKKQFGVTAQNMLEIDPDLPSLRKDVFDESKEYYNMDYSRLTPYFIEAIKELKTKLEAAEARIKTLEDS